MIRFVDAIEAELSRENWYSALLLGLRLPDICSGLTNPSVQRPRRYSAWWERYVQLRYTLETVSSSDRVLLTGGSVYALRCAYLHDVDWAVSHQQAREALNAFYFIEPPRDRSLHMTRFGSSLQLQIDVFCRDVCNGVLQWEREVAANEMVRARKRALPLDDLCAEALPFSGLMPASVYALPLNRLLH